MIWRKILVLFFLLSGLAAPVLAGEMFPATVRKIIDGDSLVVTTAEGTVEVRLYGIDCPEYDQPYSHQAKEFSRKMLGKKVTVDPIAEDSYGRTVAVVARGGDSLNEDLVQEGLAWVYPRYCKLEFCSAWKMSEELARKERKGLWRDIRPNPPWQWKRDKRGR